MTDSRAVEETWETTEPEPEPTTIQSWESGRVLPGSVLWTGVAMLMSCRCSRVSVWKRRSVDPELKAIQIPTPATAMWDTTMPSSWWASSCLWTVERGQSHRAEGSLTIILNLCPTRRKRLFYKISNPTKVGQTSCKLNQLLIESDQNLVIKYCIINMHRDCPLLVKTQLLQLNSAIGCWWFLVM